ncbi:MAG: radical SAM protein [Thiobacillus sp.]
MFHQLEVTTKCNFRCFYCAGRTMPQRHMTEATMNDIFGRLTPGRHVVSLQGEGEPTMHPRFWDWAERLRKAGYIPYTITNGSRIDAELANRHLPNLGISLDTVDEIEANRIGRLKLDCVLRNVDALLKSLGPKRLIIHTVNYGQPMDLLLDYMRAHRLTRHIIQPIQPKSDYARRYQDHPVVRPLVKHAAGTCRYLLRPLMRYFDVNGKELPCCFIKDTRDFPGVDVMRQLMSRGHVPTVCDGCSEIPEGQPMNHVAFS